MKWGVRRYQNPDGSYKSGAEGRYDQTKSSARSSVREARTAYKNTLKEQKAAVSVARKEYHQTDEYKEKRNKNIKTALKVGAIVAGTALAGYGAYKLSQHIDKRSLEITLSKGREFATNMARSLDSNSAISAFNINTNAVDRSAINFESQRSKIDKVKNIVNNKGDIHSFSGATLSVRQMQEQAQRAFDELTKDKAFMYVKELDNSTVGEARDIIFDSKGNPRLDWMFSYL